LADVADRTDDDPDTPNARFHAAQAAVVVGDRTQARNHLHSLLAMPALATRMRLQAWACLRELGDQPPAADAALVQGVVVDFGGAAGLDTVAAYVDRSAHLIQHDRRTAHVTAPDPALQSRIDELLHAARSVVAHTDPHRGQPEHPPEAGQTCIRVQTLAGAHIGLGPTAALDQDPVGGAVLRAARVVLEQLAARPSARS
jgi:hypothetical protein